MTVAEFRQAIAKLKELNVAPVEEYKLLVHPLRNLLIIRQADPTYCSYLGIQLSDDWKEIYDQTFADYWGWGINNG